MLRVRRSWVEQATAHTTLTLLRLKHTSYKCEQADSASDMRRRQSMHNSHAAASMGNHLLELVSCLGMVRAVMRTRTTGFEILASPDSITGDWLSASDAILQHRGP